MTSANQLDFHIHDEQRLIEVTMQGTITDELLLKMFTHLRGIPEFVDGYPILFDALDISTEVTGNGIYGLARLTGTYTNRMAIVTVDPMAFGMAKIYESCADLEGDRVSVFTNMQSARNWLGTSAGEAANNS